MKNMKMKSKMQRKYGNTMRSNRKMTKTTKRNELWSPQGGRNPNKVQQKRKEKEKKGGRERKIKGKTRSCLVLSCLVLSCLVLSCLVLSCLVLSCLVLSCLVLSCLVLSCLVLSCLVLSCLVLSCLVLSCLFLSCLVFFFLVLCVSHRRWVLRSILTVSLFEHLSMGHARNPPSCRCSPQKSGSTNWRWVSFFVSTRVVPSGATSR